MVGALVLRGAAVGAVAGFLAFVFARIFAEPVIDAAIEYEGGRVAAEHAAAGHEHADEGAELFSRAVQGTLGLGIGVVAFGIALGLFFALVFCLYLGRTGDVGPRQLSLLVALFGFLGIFGIPFLKYPANPPSIGGADDIRGRSGFFLLMIIVSVLVLVLAVVLGQQLAGRLGTWNATLVAGGAAIILLGVVTAVLPAPAQLSDLTEAAGRLTETPQPLRNAAGTIIYPGFDADLLYQFRLYAVGVQVVLWGALGIGFGPLAERVLRQQSATRRDELAAN